MFRKRRHALLNWLGVLLSLVSVLTALTLSSPASAAYEYVKDLPTAEQVLAKVEGDDALDTAVRRYAALLVVKKLAFELAPPISPPKLSPEEGKRVAALGVLQAGYDAGLKTAYDQAIALLRGKNALALGFTSPEAKFTRLYSEYELDREFQHEVLGDAGSEALRAERARGSAGRPSAPGTKDKSLFGELEVNAPIVYLSPGWLWREANGPSPGLAVGAALMLLSYAVVALWCTSRVKFSLEAGVVANVTVRQRSYTTRVRFEDARTGQALPGGWSTTTWSRSVEYKLKRDNGGELTIVDDQRPWAEQWHRLLVAYGGRARREWPCFAYNRSSGRWNTLHWGMSTARGASVLWSLLWTVVLAMAVGAASYFAGLWAEPNVLPLVASFVTFMSAFFVLGGFAMRIVHVFGDLVHLSRAKRLASSCLAPSAAGH